MKGFNFEKNLPHQENAVESVLSVFADLQQQPATEADRNYINPVFNRMEKQGQVTDNIILPSGQYYSNIARRQESNNIEEKAKPKSNIIDIMMETGTGKTYTYTKTIFELNRQYGIFKFIIVVPTLSIKAGTIDFLKSESSREHFREQYGKTLHLHIVESLKSGNNKKSYIPSAVTGFVNSENFEKNSIQVMIINAGMINSDTMQKSFDKGLFDKYTVPFDAIAATKPFLIIDEPHKFGTGNKTWENILKMKPQFILRYGATFQGYENLVYTLTAVDSFNRNLVKGVIGYITEFDSGKNAVVKFVDSDGTEASFELKENGRQRTVKLRKKESLQAIHSAMSDLTVENLNRRTVVLSNGMEMKKGDKINPYSYAEKLQETMIQKAVQKHFELERQLLTRDVKIKPLTLFFIDNIEEYRSKEGYIRKIVEQLAMAEIEKMLQTETDAFYKKYLEKALIDISATHGGYFSKDNSEKDEGIEKEINEILHDKQEMLSLENPRRFIFSKWTLREGWDNPNVFQICKLRSSGSDISKLQEVGRGLRLPVNEYGNRVKDEQFYLNYFVDFTEINFVDSLVNEINSKSGAISIEEMPEKLSAEMIKKICELYDTTENDLLQILDDNGVIKRNNDFKENCFNYIKHHYPKIFEGVNSNKVRKATDEKKKITVRTEKYCELKDLWEKLNEKVILEYKFDSEADFKNLFTAFLKAHKADFARSGVSERTAQVEIRDHVAYVREEQSAYGRNIATISTMKYSDFLKELSKILNINLVTIHQSMIDSGAEINSYLSPKTLRMIKDRFDHFLMANAIDKYSIGYKKVSNNIHPTKLTDETGNILPEISASNVGVFYSDEDVARSYFFDELFYDSELEMKNIKAELSEVIVFTKIPKNSIKIPVAGGKTYSPDFAYVLKLKNGTQKFNFIVETKDISSDDGLREEERAKIRHAEKFFGGEVKIRFRKQFSNNQIADLIRDIIEN